MLHSSKPPPQRAQPRPHRAEGSLAEVQRHGRWREAKTVRRYEQASRTLALLADLERPLLEFLKHCATHLALYVKGDLVAHAPAL